MRQEEISQLIHKVLSHSASQHEIQQLEAWRKASPKNERIFRIIAQVWQERSPDPAMAHFAAKRQQIWEKISNKSKASSRPKRFFNLYTRAKIAAALSFLLIYGGVIYWTNYQNGPAVQHETIQPEKIVQKVNPAGQKSKLFLPDGTVVWFNAASSLTYPARFSDSLRWVKLEGEAFFEIAKDTLKPFIVYTDSIHTTALGTSFNISAYAEDESITVALITGKVKIAHADHKDEVLLEAGKGFQFNRSNQQQQVFQIQGDKILAWKQGILMFEGDTFEQVIKKLQRWYGVKVSIEGEPPADWRLTGNFENEYLTHVIATIQFGRKFNYVLQDNTLKLFFN